jgi:hypothetical protein
MIDAGSRGPTEIKISPLFGPRYQGNGRQEERAEAHPMPMNDGFDPDQSLPSFLSGHADEQERQGTFEHELRGTSRILKASILVIAVAVSGIAVTLALGNPVKVFADATASLLDNSAAQRGADQSTPAVPSAADAQLSAPPSAGAPMQDVFAAVAEPADQAQPENSEPQSEALFSQFQAWAAKQDAQAEKPVQPVETTPAQPVEPAPAQVVDNSPAPEQPVQKHRRAKSVQNARAEIRHVQKPKARLQQNAQGQVPPVQDARALEQPVQNAQPPSFLQSLGLHQ